MIKTGKDFETTAQKFQELQEAQYESETQEKKIIARCITCKGDKIELIFTSPKRAKYNTLAEKFWTTIKPEQYSLIPEKHLVHLEPKTYWPYYKYSSETKAWLTGTGYKMIINDEPYHFPNTEYYFSSEEPMIGERAVYGIYYGDDLLYIGSASSGIEQRWKEHHEAFKTGKGQNKMYTAGFDANQIEYRTLKTAAQLQEQIGTSESISSWLLEFVEMLYIEIYQPIYNTEGKTKPFKFQARTSRFENEVPRSYWEIVKAALSRDTSESMRTELVTLAEEATEEN